MKVKLLVLLLNCFLLLQCSVYKDIFTYTNKQSFNPQDSINFFKLKYYYSTLKEPENFEHQKLWNQFVPNFKKFEKEGYTSFPQRSTYTSVDPILAPSLKDFIEKSYKRNSKREFFSFSVSFIKDRDVDSNGNHFTWDGIFFYQNYQLTDFIVVPVASPKGIFRTISLKGNCVKIRTFDIYDMKKNPRKFPKEENVTVEMYVLSPSGKLILIPLPSIFIEGYEDFLQYMRKTSNYIQYGEWF